MDGHFDCRKSKQTVVIWEIRYRVYTRRTFKGMKCVKIDENWFYFMINNLQIPKYSQFLSFLS